MSTLILVHGLLGSLEYFKPQSFLSSTRVLAPAMHGYGGQPGIDPLSLDDQAEYINNFINKNNIQEPCWLLGHSVGGAIVNIFAEKYPEKVKGIINVEGNFSLQDAFWCRSISEKNKEDWSKEYQQITSDPQAWLIEADIKPSAERIKWAEDILQYQNAASVQSVAKAVIRDTGSEQYQTTLNTIVEGNILVYLIAGEHSVKDWFVPENIKSIAKEFFVVSDSGHMMILEKPEEFCKIINTIIFQE